MKYDRGELHSRNLNRGNEKVWKKMVKGRKKRGRGRVNIAGNGYQPPRVNS